MLAKFGRDPTAGSKKVTFKFISRYIVYGSKIQSDSKLSLERVVRNERATFRPAPTDLDHAWVVCDLTVSGSSHRQPTHDQDL